MNQSESSPLLSRRTLILATLAGLGGCFVNELAQDRHHTNTRARGVLMQPEHGSLEIRDGDYERAIEMVKRSVFKVRGPEGHGSGFVLAPGVILTNRHVVEGNAFTVETNGNIVPMPLPMMHFPLVPTNIAAANDPNYSIHRFRADDREEDVSFRATMEHLGDGTRAMHSDMAVLRVPAREARDLGEPVRLGVPRLGMPIIVMGCPDDQPGYVTHGRVSRVVALYDEPNMRGTPCIQVDAGINPGNSGGPIFGLRKVRGADGRPQLIVELIGMSTYTYRGRNDMGGGIRADYIGYVASKKWGFPLMSVEDQARYEKEFPMAAVQRPTSRR